jgi:hypothetical protein
MKIVSFMAAATVAVMMTLVGCGDGPGKTPETTVPPAMQVFSGTFEVVVPDLTNPFMGMITAEITAISQDGTALTDPAALAAVIEQFGGASQTFSYTLEPAADMTTITLTGDLLTALMLPEVTATKSGALGMDLATALLGTWMTEVTDPETMATTTLTLLITAPDRFTLTLTTAPPSS